MASVAMTAGKQACYFGLSLAQCECKCDQLKRGVKSSKYMQAVRGTQVRSLCITHCNSRFGKPAEPLVLSH
eukprot:6190542-Pleurochrysis_carterae.AAC.1